MHEMSIVQALVEQCEDLAKANEATQITKVSIKVGVMSGVEPDLLQTAFDTFKEGTICSKAILDIKIQVLKVFCPMCNEEFALDQGSYDCPKCHSFEVSLTEGKDMMLMQLEMQ